MSDCDKIIGIIVLAVGGYYAYIYLRPGGIKDMNSIGASNEAELVGYLNGIVRGSGTLYIAEDNLDVWRVYWVGIQPNLVDLIQEYYTKAVANARIVYGG